jgi:hypothetical protein
VSGGFDAQLPQRPSDPGFIETFKMAGDLAVGSEHEVSRSGLDPVLNGRTRISRTVRRVQDNGHGEPAVLDVLFHDLGVVTEIDGNDRKPVWREILVKLLQVRKLLTTAASAILPEVDKHRLV